MEFEAGQTVRIRTGAFAAFTGRVEEVRVETGTLTVAVRIFGRTTPIELPFRDVEKVEFTRDGPDFSNN